MTEGVLEYTRRRLVRRRWISGGIVAGFVVAIIASALGTGFQVRDLYRGMPNIITFLVEDLLPPRFSVWRRFWKPTVETVAMSYAGTFFAVIFAAPLGFLAARNVSPNPVVMQIARAFAVFMRTIPPLVWALLLVAIVGIGPFAGALALGLSGAGMLIKSYADSIEDIDPGQVEAVVATGASRFQVLMKGVVPQFLPSFVSWSLYRFDLNIRSAAVVGLVGAGGLGFALSTSVRLFRYNEAAVAILWILGLILVIEYVTAFVRGKLL
ncbi:phosphonate transport system permease protein [Alkalispirochaeta americana]|uniref:Phosphonate transport system permease protein n=1 Tax=Alkalispirochaeta americana TaxID=159291 RepID=A0A1N6N9N2_9SPIO|nr:phosphonate ABC transporter, permease protein PhnE [Alkalispirochaeta americana]SIP88780.1 phosphonate transport system permease protein [Alkalispirochaeta americana]